MQRNTRDRSQPPPVPTHTPRNISSIGVIVFLFCFCTRLFLFKQAGNANATWTRVWRLGAMLIFKSFPRVCSGGEGCAMARGCACPRNLLSFGVTRADALSVGLRRAICMAMSPGACRCQRWRRRSNRASWFRF